MTHEKKKKKIEWTRELKGVLSPAFALLSFIHALLLSHVVNEARRKVNQEKKISNNHAKKIVREQRPSCMVSKRILASNKKWETGRAAWKIVRWRGGQSQT